MNRFAKLVHAVEPSILYKECICALLQPSNATQQKASGMKIWQEMIGTLYDTRNNLDQEFGFDTAEIPQASGMPASRWYPTDD